MRRHYPGPYTSQCQAQCRYLKAHMPRAIARQQNGTYKPKVSYGELPNKLKTNQQGGKQ